MAAYAELVEIFAASGVEVEPSQESVDLMVEAVMKRYREGLEDA